MGTVLSTPLTSKGLHRVGNAAMKVGACEMQGHRGTMEDAHSILLDFVQGTEGSEAISFFGVFDGHGSGGEWSSDWFAKSLPAYIKAKKSFKKKHIIAACLEADQAFVQESISRNMPYRDTGTTAIFCIMEHMKKPKDAEKPYKLTVGNIGDSRCLLVRADGTFQNITMDHKPQDDAEARRIVAAGGHVSGNRVNGVLAISRALGDFTFKDNENVHAERQKVIAVPDIYTVENFGGDDMLLLICDGLYEGSSNEAVIAGLKRFLKDYPDDPAVALSKLFDKQVAGSQDNMSAILVQFKDGSGYSNIKGEIEYVPCELTGGAEFSKAFHAFAKRYEKPVKQKKPKKDKKEKRGEKPSSTSTSTSTTTTAKGEKEKEVTAADISSRGRKRKESEPVPMEEDSVDEVPPQEPSTPRRSSRIQLKNLKIA